MERNEMYKKTDECLSLFKNGKRLYMESAMFNRVVQMLVRGESPYAVIEQLVVSVEDTNKAFEQYILRDTRPFLVKGDD